MNAAELLRSEAPFVADTSAWWRVASLPEELGELVDAAILADRLWITPIVRMEVLTRPGAQPSTSPSSASSMRCESFATTAR